MYLPTNFGKIFMCAILPSGKTRTRGCTTTLKFIFFFKVKNNYFDQKKFFFNLTRGDNIIYLRGDDTHLCGVGVRRRRVFVDQLRAKHRQVQLVIRRVHDADRFLFGHHVANVYLLFYVYCVAKIWIVAIQ